MLSTIGIVFLLAGTFIQSFKVKAMLQCAMFHKIALGNARVGAYETVCEPQRSNGRGAWGGRRYYSIRGERQICGAENEDVTNTFLGAVLAFDGRGLVGYTEDQLLAIVPI